MAKSSASTAYCLSCKEHVKVKGETKHKVNTSKRVVNMLQGSCPHCWNKVSRILPG